MNGAWICSCWYQQNNNEMSMLATYIRPGKKSPLDMDGFYSFIEDWNVNLATKGTFLINRTSFQIGFQIMHSLEAGFLIQTFHT